MIQTLKRIPDSASRVSTQLYLAIWGAVALTMCASLVGWLSFNRVGDVQSRVNEGSIPAISASFEVARLTGILSAAAPRLTTSATEAEFNSVVRSVDEDFEAFAVQLDRLIEGGTEGASFASILDHAGSLIENIEAIKAGTLESFVLAEESGALGAQLARLRTRLDGIIVPAIDDQLFYTITGYHTLGEPADARAEHFSEEEFGHYRHLALLQVEGNIAMELLANSFAISELSLIEPLRERFEASTSRIDRNLSALEGSPLQAQVKPIFAELSDLGTGEENGFDLIARRLALTLSQQGLVEDNRSIANNLVAEVNGLVEAAGASAETATQASSDAIFTGRTLLLAISGVSVAGALLIAWLFVGRMLVRRLKLLSDWMRRMAGGDLEATVTIEGRDEVAEMAAALEVFRRHALEVQRLNLVEKLADELKGKNDQLEDVLADLQQAQDQIVMREKLAALGELTAGVAHEIRNPLNFVNNFSEVSQELVTEAKEILEEDGVSLTPEQSGLIDDIFGDLKENLDRIRTHGERANRIVHDMLQMGRDVGEVQATNINNLLEEHARLAYHSARVMDPDFNLTLEHEFDPEMGDVQVIPQEIGRVFLNMVSNACYATDEKRRQGAESGVEGYMPTLVLATKRSEDHVEVRIKDNGNGIPQEAIDKIFNPFFTTKPTNKGTGLGLAMSNDIVRKHGGAIHVESEPGQYTVMTVELPLVPPRTLFGEEEEDEEEEPEAVAAPTADSAAQSGE